MPVEARLKQGDLSIHRELNERLPVVTNGLVAHFPFDGTVLRAQVGGRNLLLGSSDGTGWTASAKVGTEFSFSGASTGELGYIYSPYLLMYGGQTVTVSFESKNTANINSRDLFLLPTNYPVIGLLTSGFALSTTWTKVEITFTTPTTWGTVDNPLAYLTLRVDHNGSTDGLSGTIWIRNVKLELGNKATDWTPAPEDVINEATNLNNTLTNDGIAIEEATTNFVVSPTNPDGAWGTRTHTTINNLPIYEGYSSVLDVCKGYKMDKTVNCDSWSGNAYSYSLIRSHTCILGNYYTVSTWCFVSPDFDGGWVRVNAEGAVGNGEAYYDLNKKGTWQRLVNIFTPSATGNADCYLYWCKFGVINFSTLTGYIIYAAPQFEEKAFATSFVNGSRGTGNLSFPLVFSNNMTFSFSHTPNMPIASQVGQSTAPNIFELGNYYSNASLTFWCWGGVVSTYIKGDTGSGWQIIPSHITFSTDVDWLKEHKWTLVFSGTTGWDTYKVYLDGVLLTTTTLNPVITTISGNFYALGSYGGAYPNAIYKDLSIYNRALTADEVNKLTNQAFKITSIGDLITKKLVEKPNGISSDAYYFPLDFEAKDQYKIKDRMVWNNISGVAVTETSITNIGTANSWVNGCCSVEAVYGDCYVEFQAGEVGTYKMIGLSNGNSDSSYVDIDFALYPHAGNNVQVYENGNIVGEFVPYTTSDVFKVEAIGSIVKYYKNNVCFYTSGSVPVYPLLVDCSLYSLGASFKSISFITKNPSIVYENGTVWVGQATTNILGNVSNGFNGWGTLTTGISEYFIAPNGHQGVHLSITACNGGVQWYNSGYQVNVLSSTVYTVSAMIKYTGIPSVNLFYLRQYRADGSQITEGGQYNSSYQVSMGNGWYKAYATFTTHSECVRFLIQGYEYYVTETWIYDIQCEQKSFYTPFVNGTRGDGTLIIPTTGMIGTNSTIILSYIPKTNISNTIISNACYNQWWGAYHDGAGTIYMHEASTGASASSGITAILNKLNQVAISWNTTTQYLYVNGILKTTVATTGVTNAANIPNLYIGYGWTRGNAYYKDLIIVPRTLTNAEILTIYNTQMRSYKDSIQIQSEIIEEVTL